MRLAALTVLLGVMVCAQAGATTITITSANIHEGVFDSADGANDHISSGSSIYYNFNLGRVVDWVEKIDTAQLPAGTITGFRVKFQVTTASGAHMNLKAFRLKSASAWVPGKATYNDMDETGPTAWPGGATGGTTSGTDYDADASPPTVDITGTGQVVISLKTSWVSDWRDSIATNNGLVFWNDANQGTYVQMSTITGANPVFFEIDYTPPATGAKQLFFKPF